MKSVIGKKDLKVKNVKTEEKKERILNFVGMN